MELIDPRLDAYLRALVPPYPEELQAKELQAMEAFAREHNFPIIGPAVGYFCYMIARMLKARRIFELGSGYGYSTAWFARAVRENGGGEVHHTVWEESLSQQAHNHLEAMGYNDLVHYHTGEAVEALSLTEGQFDLVFNDIDKEGYPASLPVIERKLRPGGALIIDNMLWHGRIFDQGDHAGSTEGVRQFTTTITRSPNWIAHLIPVRDGLILAYKRPEIT